MRISLWAVHKGTEQHVLPTTTRNYQLLERAMYTPKKLPKTTAMVAASEKSDFCPERIQQELTRWTAF